MTATFEVGAKVRYSAKFLRSTGQYTGDVPFARGVITALRPMGDSTIATVDFKATTYEGWKNRATWNVALWIANDEPLYRAAVKFMATYKGRAPYMGFVKAIHLHGSYSARTPDGYHLLDCTLSRRELNAMMREFAPGGTRS